MRPKHIDTSRVSLRRRLRAALIIFVATSVLELGLVGATGVSGDVEENRATSDSRVQQAFLYAQSPKDAEEQAVTTPSTIDPNELKKRQDQVDRAIAAIRTVSVEVGRPAFVEKIDALTRQIAIWRAQYGPLIKASDTNPGMMSTAGAGPIPDDLKAAWASLQTTIDDRLQADYADVHDIRLRLMSIAMTLGVFGLTIGSITIVLAGRSVMKPLLRLRVLALKMARGEHIDFDPENDSGAKEIEDVRRALVSSAAKMHRQTEALEEVSEAKTTFIGYLSHELRTPLNAILGMAGSLQMDPDLTASQVAALTTIQTSGDHLLAVINDVLDLARVEAGQVSLNQEAVRVIDIVTGAMEVLRPIADNVGATFKTDVSPTAYVNADRRRAVQVLINLIGNAMKYGGEHAVVDISCTEEPGEYWRIGVADHGPGIPSDILARLFHAFERGGADRSATEGTGLGLVLSKRLVEAMDGTIGVDSTEGQGTEFWIDLPAAREPQDGFRADPLSPSEGSIPPDLMDLLRVK